MDEFEELRRWGFEIPPVDEESRSRVRQRLQALVDAEGSSRPAQRPPWKSRGRRSLVAALVALLAVVIVVIQILLPPGGGGPVSAEATLQQLSGVAAGISASTLTSGEFYYVRTTGVLWQQHLDISTGESWIYSVRVVREKWLAADGSGRILLHFSRPALQSEADRVVWQQSGAPLLLADGRREDLPFGPGELAPTDIGALPRDPSALAEVISSGGVVADGATPVLDPLGTIANLLGEVPTSGALRSALFQATARVPGIVGLGSVVDPAGRPGVGIAAVESGLRTELIFDPTTSALLATIVSRLDASGRTAQMLERESYVLRGVVTSDHVRPS